MTPSERIRHIESIARNLAGEEWATIDLSLKQFRLPISSSWGNSDRHAYIVRMIEDGEDEKLVGLLEHLSGNQTTIQNPSFWTNGYLRVFLSHISTHKKEASDLQQVLSNYAISTFVAHEDIEPTKDWQNEIEGALLTMDAFVALITPDFHSSNWTDQEIGFALARRVLVIPIRLGMDPYGFVARHQAIKGQISNPSGMANDIFHALLSNQQTQRQMREALVTKFETSWSFQEAKNNMAILEDAKSFPSDLVPRLVKAVEDNRQIRDATGVPYRLERLVKDSGIA